MKYRKSSHATFDCRYHIVWITKYRRQVLHEDIQSRLRILITGICQEMYVNILALGMEEDHVHLYASIPLSHPIPSVVQRLKGRTSKVIWEEQWKYLKAFYWRDHTLWATGYFCATVGEINHETIKHYVEEQGAEDVLGKEIDL